MRFKKIIQMFQDQNVCVFGLKGTGKDLLFGNVIVRRGLPYISNCDYSEGLYFNQFDYSCIDLAGNTYKNFITGDVKPYDFPYPDKTDLYLSDVGIYFPSQYCNELNRDFKSMPVYMAISRHLGLSNVHFNAQNLNRVWDKIREMSDTYIMCRWSVVLFGKLVIQGIRIYDKYQSALDRVKPFRMKIPFGAKKEAKAMYDIHKDSFINSHGNIKNRLLIYWHKSPYDTRLFKKILSKKGDDTIVQVTEENSSGC